MFVDYKFQLNEINKKNKNKHLQYFTRLQNKTKAIWLRRVSSINLHVSSNCYSVTQSRLPLPAAFSNECLD